MYEPLHHKYRPQTFAQLVGQGAIADTLTHALEQNRIAPAYLFCGPRGTGKTSSARILAKSLNCLNVAAPTSTPCGQCDVCKAVTQGIALDVVEIDAASNTGVDNIRELIERAQFAPVQCRYKLYVLDEVHMLSTAAFNALLKTLEEPPNRVVFVLATTDPQRVLPTIISRCQRFDFRRIPLPSMVKHLSYISREESIQIEPGAIQLVAQISQGGLRDAESLLDQLSLQTDEITVETVWDLVGAVPERDLLNLVRAIAADDSTALLERVRHLMDKGREPLIVLQSLVGFYRDLLIAKRAPDREDLVAITSPTWAEMTAFAQKLPAAMLLASQRQLQTAEVQVKNTTQPRLWLEITLTGLLPSALRATASAANLESPTVRPTPGTVNVIPPPIVAPAIKPDAAKPNESVQIDSTRQPRQSAPATASALPVGSTGAASISPPVIPTEPQAPNVKEPDRKAASTHSLPTRPVSSDPSAQKTSPTKNSDLPKQPAAVAFGNLADLWKQILAVLEPRGTQMLMSQQGVLLGFDGVGAKVGFRSAPLQKAARERVPNLEAAFQKVFQRPIKISLEIVTVPKSTESNATEPNATESNATESNAAEPNATESNTTGTESSSSSSAQPPASRSPVPRHPDSLSDENSNGSLQSRAEQDGFMQDRTAEDSKQPAQTDRFKQPASETVEPTPFPSANSRNSRLEAPADMQFLDQDQEKIKRFANFFNGQIVSLEGDTDSSLQRSSTPKPAKSEDSPQTGQNSSAPGPDVPF